MKILLYLLFLTVVSADDHDYIDDYFDLVVANFNKQLLDYRLINLKINDTLTTINRTINGVKLEGTATYTNALITNLATLSAMKEGHRGYPDDTGVNLFYQINFPNLTIFSDVDVTLSNLGSQKGSAEFLFLNTSIAVYINKNYTTGSTSLNVVPYATMGPQTNFQPVSDIMDAAGRVARLELGSTLLWNQVADWCVSPFLEMITKAVDAIEYPIIPPVSIQPYLENQRLCNS